MVVRMRSTRGHTGNRRSHHALKEPRLSTCENCSAKHLRHRACPNCGHYRGRMVVDIVAKQEKRTARYDAKLKKMGVDVDAAHKKEAEAAKAETKETKTATKKTAAKKTAVKKKVDKPTDKKSEK